MLPFLRFRRHARTIVHQAEIQHYEILWFEEKRVMTKDDLGTSAPVSPYFRIYLCGTFRAERRVGDRYEVIQAAEWGGSTHPRQLLKVLLCCPGRQGRREALIEMLWPDGDFEQAARYFNTATTKLRAALRPLAGQESLLHTEQDASVYRLADQPLLWVDADAGVALLNEAEQRGRTSPSALALLEQAANVFNKGMLLQEEEGLWVVSKRATMEQIRYRCRIWLAEAYEHQDRPGQAEMILSLLLEEDPTDEDAFCRLLALLHRQGMTHQALRLYKQFCETLAAEGLEASEATKVLVAHLQEGPNSRQYLTNRSISQSLHTPLPHDGVQHVLEPPKLSSTLMAHSDLLELTSSANTLFSIPSLFRTDSDVLAHIGTVLSKPTRVGEKGITYFDQQTRLYWRAREETALPATVLYTYVMRHLDDLSLLLAHSQLPILRSYLCEIVCRTLLLAGILLYDQGQYAKARQHYQMAFQAATEANCAVLQAIVWGWTSFTWTYTKYFREALHCVQQARAFALQTTDVVVQAWLGAIEAEVQAHLYDRGACLQSLSEMERGMGIVPSQDISYLFEFNSTLLLGYKGVCLQQFYHPQDPATYSLLQEAKESLEQALASEAPLKRKLYYLSDLAGVYARQGEVEAACAYVVQSIPAIIQVGSGSKTIRKHLFQVRALLQPNAHTSSVQALDQQMASLLVEGQAEEM